MADATVTDTNASCGDDITVTISFDETKKIITHIGWTGNGCAISQAGMSLLSEKVIGMSREAVSELDQRAMERLLGIEQPIAYGRVKCLLLGLKAVQRAIESSNNN